MTHAEGFSFLSYRDKIKEIEDSERIIADTLGVLTKGFRTPGNDVDGETLRILEGRGYIYDSSLMPTYYGPIFKLLKFSSSKITRKNHYLGRPAYGLSPLSPYHPDGKKIWKRGDMNLLEIPITTMPCLRIPFHASFTFATYQLGFGIALFDMGYRLLKATNLPLNFVFHTNELSDPVKDSRIRRQYGLSLPLEDKYRICRRILDAIHKDFTFKTTTEYAITYEK
jgi:hypothetical protein